MKLRMIKTCGVGGETHLVGNVYEFDDDVALELLKFARAKKVEKGTKSTPQVTPEAQPKTAKKKTAKKKTAKKAATKRR